MHLREACFSAGLVFGLAAAAASPVSAAGDTYEFRVFLGDRDIGSQTFLVQAVPEETRVDIQAEFDVTVFLIPVYRYRHVNEERWVGGCIRRMRSTTRDGGDDYFVRADFTDGVLTVENVDGTQVYGGCVRSYAYWDRQLLRGDALLNSQTGKVDRVSFRDMGEERISVRGVETAAERLRIESEGFHVDLWYAGGRWVALQSMTSGGDVLRYVLQ